MKTDSSMTTRQPASGTRPVLEQLRAGSAAAARGTGKTQDAMASLSFRALFADIQVKPGSFEDMTQKMAERRAEQGRLERERGRSRPRAEDAQPASAPEPQRAAEPVRPARTEENRSASRAPERVKTPEGREREPVRSAARAEAGVDGRAAAGKADAGRRTQTAGQESAAPTQAATRNPQAQAGQAPRQASADGRRTDDIREAASADARLAEDDGVSAVSGADMTAAVAAAREVATTSAARGTAPGANTAETVDAALQNLRGLRRADAGDAASARKGAPDTTATAGTDTNARPQAARPALPGDVAVMHEAGQTQAAQAQADMPVNDATLQQLARDMGLPGQAAGDDTATPAGGVALQADAAGDGMQVAVDAGSGEVDVATLASMTDAAQGTLRRAGASGASGTGTQAGKAGTGQAGAVGSSTATQGMRTTATASPAATGRESGQGTSEQHAGTFGADRTVGASAAGGDAVPTAGASVAHTEGAPFSLGMASQAGSAHSPSRIDGSPLLSSRIDSSIHSAEFKEQFARQVAGVVMQGQDRAEIRLTPAELGPIRIRIALNAEDAALDISAAHAATRAAIESSMHTLRQMLADHGVRLADYRMDQGLLSQQRQPGQDTAAGAQQFGAAFGQGNGQQDGRQAGTGQRSTHGDMTASGNGPAAVSGGTGGRRGVGNTASDGRLDLFA